MRPVFLLAVPLLSLLSGCGKSVDVFVQDFVEADCAFLMECTSEPVLSFLGWQTAQDCMDDRGPQVTADAERCEYDKKAARACIDAVELAECPAEDEDRVYPPICQDVFTACTDIGPGTDTDTDTDTEAAAQ